MNYMYEIQLYYINCNIILYIFLVTYHASGFKESVCIESNQLWKAWVFKMMVW